MFEMGAERLDAYLSFQVKSRSELFYDVTHDRVNDMRGEFAETCSPSCRRKWSGLGSISKPSRSVWLCRISCRSVGIRVRDASIGAPRAAAASSVEAAHRAAFRLIAHRCSRTNILKTRLTMQVRTTSTLFKLLSRPVWIKFAALLRYWWICAHRKTHMLNKGKHRTNLRFTEAECERKPPARTPSSRRRWPSRRRTEPRRRRCNEAQDVILTKARSDLEVAEFTGRTEKAELVEKTKIECARRVRRRRKNVVETTRQEAREASPPQLRPAARGAPGESKAAEYQEERIRRAAETVGGHRRHFAAR